MPAKPTYEELQEKVHELENAERERDRAEARLARLTSDWQATLDAANDAIWVLDKNQRILRCNESSERMFRHSSEEMVGQVCSKFVDGGEQPIPESPVCRAVRSLKRETTELEISGKWLQVTVDPVIDPNGRFNGAIHIVRDITERREMEKELRERERKYRNLFENGSDLLCIHDLEGNLLETNLSYKKQYGLDNENLMGLNIRDFIPERHKPEFDQYLARVMQNGEDDGFLNVFDNLGNEVILEYKNRLIYDIEGKPAAVQGSARDVTARLLAEKAIRESEEKYRILFETISYGVIYHNSDGQITSVNPAAERILGQTLEEMQGLSPSESCLRFIHEDGSDFKEEEHPSMLALRSGEMVRDVVMGVYNPVADEDRWINVTAIPQFRPRNEKPSQVYAIFEDITTKKRAFDQAARLAAIVHSTQDAVISKTPEGIITSWNPSAERMYGYSADEVIGKNISIIVPDTERDDLLYLLERIRRGETVDAYEATRQTKDGRSILVSLCISPIHDEVGRVIGASTIARDVTELRQAERDRLALQEQLEQAQRLESIGRLAAGIAHDFNNMLSVILGYGQDLFERLHAGDPLRESAMEILEAGRRSAALTRQLLAFSRKQTLRPEVLNLNDVVAPMEDMLRRVLGEDIALSIHLAEGLDRVEVDPSQMEQVIMNLAVNSRDAMPGGGNLTIETGNVELDEEYADGHVGVVSGKYVMLSISDSGSGMDEETQERIFEPFFTTKEKDKGTGLGLSTVYGIVKQSKGNIWVYSERGRGTTFKVYLPQTTNKLSEKKTRVKDASVQGNGERVLIVEDEPALRRLCTTILEGLNYHVTAAANGGEALLLIEEQRLCPDLIITDVVMPEMSGTALVDRLRRNLPDLRVLYMSGYTDTAIVREGVLDSGTPFIQKPFSKGRLGRVIKGLLGEAKESSQS